MLFICPDCGSENVVPTLIRRGSRIDHAAYMRAWRKRRPHRLMSDEARKRAIVRAKTRVYRKRGLIKKTDCPCGAPATEMHHEDYSNALSVVWLCRQCHVNLHRERRIAEALAASEGPAR